MFSFTKADRLLKRKDFLKLSYSGKKVCNQYFIALYLPAGNNKKRLGVTVSRKTGKAVVRSRIKRLIREFFRLNKEKIKGGANINIIAKKKASGLNSKEVFIYLENIFEKVSKDFDN